MKIYKNLYLSDSLKHKSTKVVQKMLDGSIQLNTYVIVLTNPKNNRLEIYNLLLNQQSAFPMKDVLVVGIANGHDEALELMTTIVEDVYRETNSADVVSFIKRHQLDD